MKRNIKRLLLLMVVLIAVIILIPFLFLKKPFRYAGTLEVTKVDISSRLAGLITELIPEEGDKVQSGDTLVVLDCDDYKIAARLAKENYDRNIKLSKPGYVTPESIDQLKTQLDDANIRVGWCTLISPIQGKVLSRYHEPGEWMSAGTKILTLGNIKDIWAYIYVPQPLVANLSYGMILSGYLPELNNRKFEGRIIKINDEAEFTPKNVQTQSERERLIYGVKVSFLDSNTDEILKPGMTIEIELPPGNKNQKQ